MNRLSPLVGAFLLLKISLLQTAVTAQMLSGMHGFTGHRYQSAPTQGLWRLIERNSPNSFSQNLLVEKSLISRKKCSV